MTRKDYVLIAAALAAAGQTYSARLIAEARDQWVEDCHALADALARDNARFDRERFLTACGVQS